MRTELDGHVVAGPYDPFDEQWHEAQPNAAGWRWRLGIARNGSQITRLQARRPGGEWQDLIRAPDAGQALGTAERHTFIDGEERVEFNPTPGAMDPDFGAWSEPGTIDRLYGGRHVSEGSQTGPGAGELTAWCECVPYHYGDEVGKWKNDPSKWPHGITKTRPGLMPGWRIRQELTLNHGGQAGVHRLRASFYCPVAVSRASHALNNASLWTVDKYHQAAAWYDPQADRLTLVPGSEWGSLSRINHDMQLSDYRVSVPGQPQDKRSSLIKQPGPFAAIMRGENGLPSVAMLADIRPAADGLLNNNELALSQIRSSVNNQDATVRTNSGQRISVRSRGPGRVQGWTTRECWLVFASSLEACAALTRQVAGRM